MPSKVYYISFKRPLHHFTLVEMLVVIAIIAILSSIMMPSINKAMISAYQTSCSSNLKSIGIAYISYAADNNSYLPTNSDPRIPWRLGQFGGFISDGQYISYKSSEWGCPSLSANNDFASDLGYSLVAISGDTSSAFWPLWYNSYGRISISKLTSNGMNNTSNVTPANFSARVLATDIFYGYDGNNYYGPSIYRSDVAAHSAVGSNSVFADGHVEWFVNYLGNSPSSFAECALIYPPYLTLHWLQSYYVAFTSP